MVSLLTTSGSVLKALKVFWSIWMYLVPAAMFSSGSSMSLSPKLLAVLGIICMSPIAPRGDLAWMWNMDSFHIMEARSLQSQPTSLAFFFII